MRLIENAHPEMPERLAGALLDAHVDLNLGGYISSPLRTSSSPNSTDGLMLTRWDLVVMDDVHRYGQKHDVVVSNFLNLSKANATDKRVFELLSNKCKLFSRVFDARFGAHAN